MSRILDTNVLVRAVVRDDVAQTEAAERLLREGSRIVVTLSLLCEMVWVLRRLYRFSKPEIAAALRALLAAETVVMNRPAAEAGLELLEAGGDFADVGRPLAGRRAVRLLRPAGSAAAAGTGPCRRVAGGGYRRVVFRSAERTSAW